MAQNKSSIETTTIDEQFFHLFHASNREGNSLLNSEAFTSSTSTPEKTLFLFNTLKNQVSAHELDVHQSVYLLGITTAIRRNNWTQAHADDLVGIADWFLAHYKNFRSAGPRKAQLKFLTDIIQMKVQVDPATQEAWKKRLTPRPINTPRGLGLQPAQACPEPFKNRSGLRSTVEYER